MLKIVFICLALWSGSAWSESWTGEDKALHFAGSATLATVVTVVSASPQVGFWSAVAVGVTKELIDRRRPGGDASLRDLAADVAGAYLGSQAGRWMLYRQGETTTLVLAFKF